MCSVREDACYCRAPIPRAACGISEPVAEGAPGHGVLSPTLLAAGARALPESTRGPAWPAVAAIPLVILSPSLLK